MGQWVGSKSLREGFMESKKICTRCQRGKEVKQEKRERKEKKRKEKGKKCGKESKRSTSEAIWVCDVCGCGWGVM